MPITYKTGDLLKSNAQCLVNPVNCVGIMGKGIAKQFKEQYPWCYAPYVKVCCSKRFHPGMLFWVTHPSSEKIILCFPTKDDWRDPSRLGWIISGLQRFVATYESRGITSVAFPPLGCGNGQLEWDVVAPTLDRYLNPLPIRVEIYLPCR